MSASQGSESPTVEELQALDLQCEQSSVEKWNRLYPIGTEIRYNDSNGHAVDTTTRSNAEVYALPRNETRKYAPIHVAGICLQGIETPVRLDCCFPKIPKELEFLLENLPAQDLRNKFEQFRDGLDITAVLYALAASWSKYEAPKRTEEEAEILRKCAKQLRQRADWVKDDLVL